MKQLKKLILFLVLFLFVIFLKTTVFGVTLTEIEYNGVIYKPDVEPLTLQTTTNSYIVSINKDLNTIYVAEPYNKDDYLASCVSTSASVGTYNRIVGYSCLTNSLADIYYYKSSYSNGVWSAWSKTSAKGARVVAPR